jgi:hypothetical protein
MSALLASIFSLVFDLLLNGLFSILLAALGLGGDSGA